MKPWVSPGSEFDRRRAAYTPLEDLSPGYIHLTFHCTLAMYEKGRFSSATPCASGLVVLPTKLSEGQIQEFAGWFRRAVAKSVRDSTWFANNSIGAQEHRRTGAQEHRNTGAERGRARRGESLLPTTIV